MSLQAVIFDLDGVIVFTSEYHYLAWKRLAEEQGCYFDRQKNEKFKGVSRQDCARMLFPEITDASQLEELAIIKNGYYKEFLNELRPESVVTGVLTLLDEIKSGGIKTAVASVSKNTHRVLEKLHLSDHFDCVVDGNGVERSKPAPDVFLAVSENLHIEPSNCVVIEDASAGIEAANVAGMMTIGVGDRLQLAAAKQIVSDVNEIDMKMLFQIFE